MVGSDVEVPDGTDLLKSSSLYREFQAEREEILRHKYYESQKAGYDIGFERALTDWIVRHRAKWRRGRDAAHERARRDKTGQQEEGRKP